VSGELIAARGEADRHLALGPTVDLGRPARPWPTSSWWAAVADVEEPVPDQLVQMELGHVQGDAGAGRRLFAAHRIGLGHHEAVQIASRRLGQCRDAAHLGVEVGGGLR
jgi:hypothetical protein